MALKSTVFKAELQVADMDRAHYGTHALTLAQHPSENDERMMVRLLAYALHAEGEDQAPLSFANAMTEMDEPDLWRRSLVGDIELWVDVGQPEEKWVRKASHRSREVVLYIYGRNGSLWWGQNRGPLEKLANLRVRQVPAEASTALALLARRSMRLQCTVQDGTVWLGDGDATVEVELVELKEAVLR
ncbi:MULTISPECIES: YaeQ family protein [unclassified Methylibium]|uniref:YaeQ family protein n=1 Tax=unclassified Methylibium TaxID=2633235 RepID=UPI0003F45AE7|nr:MULTISPECIES: YaeQ family protein [unclassified Methylibium]EWS55403.1 YaeQ protein [Methylibium sp. T29]EWS60083.1 YaeQ protein [Methylibium sp. T29-B]